jgi:hypothetical protein
VSRHAPDCCEQLRIAAITNDLARFARGPKAFTVGRQSSAQVSTFSTADGDTPPGTFRILASPFIYNSVAKTMTTWQTAISGDTHSILVADLSQVMPVTQYLLLKDLTNEGHNEALRIGTH